jgi:hypothetical protein
MLLRRPCIPDSIDFVEVLDVVKPHLYMRDTGLISVSKSNRLI